MPRLPAKETGQASDCDSSVCRGKVRAGGELGTRRLSHLQRDGQR